MGVTEFTKMGVRSPIYRNSNKWNFSNMGDSVYFLSYSTNSLLKIQLPNILMMLINRDLRQSPLRMRIAIIQELLLKQEGLSAF